MHDFDPAYLRYVKSEKWKQKCALYWMKYGRFCKACGNTKGPLQVHHMSYEHLGREPMADLMGVCSPCHREIHRAHRQSGRRKDLRTVTLEHIQKTRRERFKNR